MCVGVSVKQATLSFEPMCFWQNVWPVLPLINDQYAVIYWVYVKFGVPPYQRASSSFVPSYFV